MKQNTLYALIGIILMIITSLFTLIIGVLCQLDYESMLKFPLWLSLLTELINIVGITMVGLFFYGLYKKQ
jgi:ABC-type antimicrobial peptide transport system permease subunit